MFFSPILRRRILWALAIIFAASTVAYSVLWMYYARARQQQPQASIGITYDSRPTPGRMRAIRVSTVEPGSPAAQAGLQVGDRIMAVNGRSFHSVTDPIIEIVVLGKPGENVQFTVERTGQPAPMQMNLTLGQPRLPERSPIALELLLAYPVLFVVVGLSVLFLRIDSRDAWLLALLFAGFISAAPLIPIEGIIDPRLRPFAVAYMTLFYGMTPSLFYFFFSTFPVSSPLDRRVPWLKWLLLVISGVVVVPLSLWIFWEGSSYPLWFLAQKMPRSMGWIVTAIPYGTFFLGFVSLVWNTLSAPTAEARRKTRVIVWGMLVGFAPFLVVSVVALARNRDIYDLPFLLWAPIVLNTFLIPLSIAYAVVKHRVLEIPVLVRRGARYLLVQRGFAFLMGLVAAGATVWIAKYVSGRLAERAEIAVGLGVMFGMALVWGSSKVHSRVKQRIDRAFFRSAYDARQILEDLAVRTRDAGSRQELAQLLEGHVQQALLPTSLVVYLDVDDSLLAYSDVHPASLHHVSNNLPALMELSRRRQPVEIPPQDGAGSMGEIAQLQPEILVPITDREARLRGLMLLGPRRSEEPYSGEDMRLLGSVASQAAVALENIRLGEKIAERLEAERVAARELEIAQEVQQKLLPQKRPELARLEYAAKCVQARVVGGDYYDFLDLSPGVMGFVLADIAGKGISAALLMANLQANLRSQYALALTELDKLLRSVNRLFYESTEPSKYATLFFGVYSDDQRCLRYANCGHNPAILLRDGQARRLGGTSTVLGLFEDWECSIAQVPLQKGDLLAVFSDGITEAEGPNGEEFGDQRLIKALQANRHLPPEELLTEVVREVQQFSSTSPTDDLTLFVARVR